ncbi:MAG: NifU family protein [Cytophagales bacterium]|nr:MAG: NifU family protein [Cytophagales bacterium]
MMNRPKSVQIYTESNPNPQALKFVLNYIIVPEGVTLDFPDAETAQDSPLAAMFFEQFPYIQRVFMMNNFLTITKNESVEWAEVAIVLKEALKKYVESEQPIFSARLLHDYEQEFQAAQHEDSEVVKKIKGVLDEYIRPAVETDGGAISFHSFEEGTVKVLLQGACSGCPSSTITLKAGIETLLKRMVPEVTTVVAEGV